MVVYQEKTHDNMSMNRRRRGIKKTETLLDKHSITITKNTKRIDRTSLSPVSTLSEPVAESEISHTPLPRHQKNIRMAINRERERERERKSALDYPNLECASQS